MQCAFPSLIGARCELSLPALKAVMIFQYVSLQDAAKSGAAHHALVTLLLSFYLDGVRPAPGVDGLSNCKFHIHGGHPLGPYPARSTRSATAHAQR